MGYRVVVAGATGNVGREMLNILAEREFPIDDLALLASARSTGDEIPYGDTDKTYKVRNIEHFDWAGWDIALFAIGSDATAIYAKGQASWIYTATGKLHGFGKLDKRGILIAQAEGPQ